MSCENSILPSGTPCVGVPIFRKEQNHMTDIQPLVVTPRPYAGESLKGFILRTSALNGYDSPSVMLGAAGMLHGEMHAMIPPIEKLAPLYARTPQEFAEMGYRRPWNDRFTKSAPILHHHLPTAYTETKHARVCPECVLERGFVEAFWDLRHAIACPVHGREALRACPECGKRLTWFRPGLLTCACGCDLAHHRGAEVAHLPTLGLLGLLRSKLMGLPMDHALLTGHLGFPVEPLDAMSLPTLIGIIGRFEGRPPGYNHRIHPDRPLPPPERVLGRSADALAHWPQGFYDYLQNLEPEEGSKKGFGLRRQFESFFGSFFKSGLPESEVAFIREAFLRFGSEVWKQGYVSKALNRDSGLGRNVVGIYGLAKALGVMPSTARNLVAKGQIQGTPITANGRTRLLFDLDQPLPFRTGPGVSLSLRRAAAWLGLPVSVLRLLRDQGRYTVHHLADPTAAYHMRDLQAFRERLLACAPDIRIRASTSCVTLSQAMQMKAGTPLIKAALVGAVLDGEVLPLGRDGDQAEELVFDRAEVEAFLRQRKEEHFGSMTVVATAKFLHCDPVVVKHLYRDGVLAGEKKPRGIFIRTESAKAFREDFISCAAIASMCRTQSNNIVQRCEQENIPIQWFPRGRNQSPQPFVDRATAREVWGAWLS